MGNSRTHQGSGISSETAAIPLQSATGGSATKVKEHSEPSSDWTRGLEAATHLTHSLCSHRQGSGWESCSSETTQGSWSHFSGQHSGHSCGQKTAASTVTTCLLRSNLGGREGIKSEQKPKDRLSPCSQNPSPRPQWWRTWLSGGWHVLSTGVTTAKQGRHPSCSRGDFSFFWLISGARLVGS